MALESKAGEQWLSNKSKGWGSSDYLQLDPKDFFVVTEEYQKVWDEYLKKTSEENVIIEQIQAKSDMLITRITLASDKILERMINEVGDMGDLSLIDVKIKGIGSGEHEQKKLNG